MLVVRKVRKDVYKKFKQKALEEDENVGEALTEAMQYWMKAKRKKEKINVANLLKLNGIVKAGKRVRWSEQVDEILYGGKA